MKDSRHLYQHKQISKTHTVKVSDLEELRKNALDEGLYPVYIVESSNRRWFMISELEWELSCDNDPNRYP